ncbi:cobalamin biosynthesis family protein [Aliivibrio sp. S4TY2]|uniref:cobalamin biosynthesis family protein n=1 Tax=unclassified Aliivibrio TaxID=2645654 RepID=UPI0023785E64|nr:MULTISPECIES: cobalamin biosynthesis family protein [unclassified Aliivibrio]MDD9158107.1 cobalamin biosynthesis family protein [Aliivibrio sp. S4TY2]MDD9162022.1 cobalamin biosynthesis family protein [Aliivibrio sp. S4TY1]MDD9166104.1 cobalamin biosynthesis family protein [Aliivibrio sp. S4MY2]MDD9170102.1 cobalamin biosynthesis family protein [Aliivibrio sp. S4MY4]MDD9187153.1 cobalamin biosynthesis family protein [Aliivibrio sp. S4MY3]
MLEKFSLLIADYSLLVLWGALLFHLLLPIPVHAHPMTIWRKFAELLANKVNNTRSYQQRFLSGSLAWALMIIPAFIVCIAAQPIVWNLPLFNLGLLLISLEWRGVEKLCKDTIQSINQNNKEEAKTALQPWVNRDVEPLSLLGLGKASAETIILGYARTVIGVLFWYGIAGGVGAFIYRLSLELARAWSPSRDSFRPFGIPALTIQTFLDFIPLKLFSLLCLIGKHLQSTLHTLNQQRKSWVNTNNAWLLIIIGKKFELSLGGPVIYQGKKISRPKLGGKIAPSALHLAQIHRFLSWRIAIWLILQSTLMVIIKHGL